jgi:hypothetical protein
MQVYNPRFGFGSNFEFNNGHVLSRSTR